MSVTIATIMKDEAERLPAWLACVTEVADRIVAVDNDSSDATPDILKDAGATVVPLKLPMDGNEWKARKFLWDEAVRGADWVVHLDADQVFANDFRPHLKGNRVAFRVYDMWSPTHFREDAWWRGHIKPWWNAVRVTDFQDHEWEWSDRGWHSGHLPMNAKDVGRAAGIPIDCSILHYGYVTPELREKHQAAYEARSEHLTGKELHHARTITFPRPVLYPLPFEPRWTMI